MLRAMHEPTTRPVRRGLRAVSLLAAALIASTALVACGDDEGGEEATEDTTSTTEAAEESTATTEAEDETTTTTEAEDGKGPGDKEEPTGPVDESDIEAWARTAVPFRDQVGEIIEFDCPAGGEPFNLWGTNVYTDDSSVCTAAVHVGLITFADGGTVEIEILGPSEEYEATESNDVLSAAYGPWGGSFSFPDAEGIEAATSIGWNVRAVDYADEGDVDITVQCASGGEAASLWGTDIYTSDSSICTAAVHVGLITFEDGGEVTFHLIEGQESYTGSEANGVTSADYGSWDASFEFVEGGLSTTGVG
jgi:phage baseplate assembly protein gpV